MGSGPKEKVIAFAVDNDNCIANQRFIDLYAMKDNLKLMDMKSMVSGANLSLIAGMQHIIVEKKPKHAYLMPATNRQDYFTDADNAAQKKNGSFVPVIRTLHECITTDPRCAHLKLETHLMADTYAKQKSGTEFARIEKIWPKLQELNAKKYKAGVTKEERQQIQEEIKKLIQEFKSWVFDGSKFSITWRQMHQLAAKHKHEDVEYHVIDDSDEILSGQDVYVAPALPDLTTPVHSAEEARAKDQLHETLKRAVLFTPNGLYVRRRAPEQGYVFEQVLAHDDPRAAKFQRCFEEAGRAALPMSIKKECSDNELRQLDDSLDELGCHNVTGLKGLYEKFPELIPKNVTLTLHRYDGVKMKWNVVSVQGKGEIDYQYDETVRNITTELCGDDCLTTKKEYDLADLYRKYKYALAMRVKKIEDFKDEPRIAYHQNDFLGAIEALRDKLREDFTAQFSKPNFDKENVLTSHAGKIFFELEELNALLMDNDISAEKKLEHIKAFEDACCSNKPDGKTYLKALAVFICAAVGFVLGAAAGFAAGFLAGAWSGPGAAATAVLGLFKGSITGYAIGLAAGAGATGVAAATASGILLFKSDPLTKAARQMVNQAKEKYQGEVARASN
jgi:hypothetical protein